MPERAYDKKCIALAQLETALRLYEDHDFIASITLAGAAEEIFGKLIEARKGTNALASLRLDTAAMYKHLFGEPIDRGWVARRANQARNALKHLDAGGYPTVTRDLEEEALDMLNRSIDNYWGLEQALTPAMEAFERARRAT